VFLAHVKRFILTVAVSLPCLLSLAAQTPAPKVVAPLTIQFLLRQGARGDRKARETALTSLREMARGAVHDQVGGGFHHQTFEKLLSDQALLAIAYTEAWQVTGDAEYRRVARRTLDYVLRDLPLKGGGFAPLQGRESLIPDHGPRMAVGRYYAWEFSELRRLLGPNFDLIAYYFGMKEEGNVPDSTGSSDLRGWNVPFVAHTDAETCARFNLTRDQLASAVEAALARMQLVRSHRPQPLREAADSIANDALVISALSRAGVAFDESRYTYAAIQGAKHVTAAMREPKRASNVEEYANTVQAMIDVYQTTFDSQWLKTAIAMQQRQDELFWNGTQLRYANATAQTNGTAAVNLMRLAAVTENATWRIKAEAILRSFGQDDPVLADAASVARAPVRVVVIEGSLVDDRTKALLRVVGGAFDPQRVVVAAGSRRVPDPLAPFVPALARAGRSEVPAVTLCRGSECSSPIVDPARLNVMLLTDAAVKPQ
jgi:uncharacterized protein YyaL (SSP411 family)